MLVKIPGRIYQWAYLNINLPYKLTNLRDSTLINGFFTEMSVDNKINNWDYSNALDWYSDCTIEEINTIINNAKFQQKFLDEMK